MGKPAGTTNAFRLVPSLVVAAGVSPARAGGASPCGTNSHTEHRHRHRTTPMTIHAPSASPPTRAAGTAAPTTRRSTRVRAPCALPVAGRTSGLGHGQGILGAFLVGTGDRGM